MGSNATFVHVNATPPIAYEARLTRTRVRAGSVGAARVTEAVVRASRTLVDVKTTSCGGVVPIQANTGAVQAVRKPRWASQTLVGFRACTR